MNLRQRLDEIRQLEQKATPGKWGTSVEIDGYMAGKRSVVQKPHGLRITTVGQTRPHDLDHAEVNAALIAAMRNAIGPLLEVVEQQHVSLLELMAYFEKGEFLAGMEKRANAALSLMDREES